MGWGNLEVVEETEFPSQNIEKTLCGEATTSAALRYHQI